MLHGDLTALVVFATLRMHGHDTNDIMAGSCIETSLINGAYPCMVMVPNTSKHIARARCIWPPSSFSSVQFLCVVIVQVESCCVKSP